MSHQANNIFAGTQVVSLVEVRGTNNSLVHPRGAVGVVTRTPAVQGEKFLVRFPDGFEASLAKEDIDVLKHCKDRLPSAGSDARFELEDSWNRAPRPQAGYKVVFIPFDEHGMPKGGWDDFAEGFPGVEYFTNTRDARYRPCGVAVGPDGSLYIGETQKGRIWRVIYTGESAPSRMTTVAVATGQTYAPVDADTPGGKLYAQACAACHMPNGSGVPDMQPALKGSAVVAGETDQLINVLLKGPAAVLPADREKFSNVMPPFAIYTDDQIASLINYLRANFAASAPKVTPEQVAEQRSQL